MARSERPFLPPQDFPTRPPRDPEDDLLEARLDSPNPDIELAYRIFSLVCFMYTPIIIVNNIFFFLGIVMYPGFKTSLNVLLMNLAIANLLMGFYCVPLFGSSYTSTARKELLGSKVGCLIRFSSFITSAGGSLWSLFFITLEQYIYLNKPLCHQKKISIERMLLFIVFFWSIALAVGSLPLIGFNNFEEAHDNDITTENCNFFRTLSKLFLYATFIGPCAGSLVISTFISIKNLLKIRWRPPAQENDIAKIEKPTHGRSIHAKLTLYLLAASLMLWSPFMVVIYMQQYKKASAAYLEISKTISLLLGFTNPILCLPIFAIFSAEHRYVYGHMLTTSPCKWHSTLINAYCEYLCKPRKGEKPRLQEQDQAARVEKNRFVPHLSMIPESTAGEEAESEPHGSSEGSEPLAGPPVEKAESNVDQNNTSKKSHVSVQFKESERSSVVKSVKEDGSTGIRKSRQSTKSVETILSIIFKGRNTLIEEERKSKKSENFKMSSGATKQLQELERETEKWLGSSVDQPVEKSDSDLKSMDSSYATASQATEHSKPSAGEASRKSEAEKSRASKVSGKGVVTSYGLEERD